jgi:hypothetical protein
MWKVQILDNIILAHELIHSLNSTKKPGMLIKLDLSKAFDNLSWDYIHNTLLAFGFSLPWIQWIMSLLTSSFFSILVNGSPSPTFSPSREFAKEILSHLFFSSSWWKDLVTPSKQQLHKGNGKASLFMVKKNQQLINNLLMIQC